MNYKIAHLSLSASQKAGSAVFTMVAQEDKDKEDLAGKLFLLVEIESKEAQSYKLIDFLSGTLVQNYYQNEKLILREKNSALKVEHIFESALVKTNKNLAEFIKEEKINLDLKKINATIGLIFENEIHLTSLGRNKSLLIFRAQNDGQYKITEIGKKDSAKPDEEINPTKIFANLISGTLPPESFFIAANETLSEYMSSKQLIEIVTVLPPTGAAEQIKNRLSSLNAYASFLAIIVKNTITDAESANEEITPAATSQDWIETLNATEYNTERLLAPAGLISLKAKTLAGLAASRVYQLLGRQSPPKTSAAKKIFITQDKLSFAKKSSAVWLAKLSGQLKNIASLSANLLLFVAGKISIKKIVYLPSQSAKIAVAALKSIGAKIAGWKQIHWIAVSVVFVCFLLVLGNIIISNRKNKQVAENKRVNEIAQTIEQKQNEIDSSLLYKDEERARKLFAEINSLITQLPQNNEEQKVKIEKVNEKLKEQINKISKTVEINPIVELVNLANQGANAKPENIVLVRKNAELYSASPATKSIYAVNVKNKAVAVIAADKYYGALSSPSTDKNENIYYYGANQIAMLDANKHELSPLEFKLPAAAKNIIGAKIFNSRFYFLDPAANQIYRFSKTGGKLENGAGWLKAPADLSDATAMDIDGKIYVLGKKQIQVFDSGQPVDFKLSTVIPELTDATRIKISPDLNFIYVLEPKNKRLIVFDKSGALIIQYFSEGFNDLKDFAVDETAKKIYLLNSASIFTVDATHIK